MLRTFKRERSDNTTLQLYLKTRLILSGSRRHSGKMYGLESRVDSAHDLYPDDGNFRPGETAADSIPAGTIHCI